MTANKDITVYSYKQFLWDVHLIANQINQSEWKPDVIFAVARGGLTFAAYLAHKLGIKQVIEINTYLDTPPPKLLPKPGKFHHYILVDDISDSGETLVFFKEALVAKMAEDRVACECVTATLWIRHNTKMLPDFYARTCMDNSWIEFPWEGDITKQVAGSFIEILSKRHQVFDPPMLLSVKYYQQGYNSPNRIDQITIVSEPEYATVFETPTELYNVIHELQKRLGEFVDLYNLGLPVLSEHVYNPEKMARYQEALQKNANQKTVD